MTHRSVISLSLLSLVFLLGCSNVTRPLAAINPIPPPVVSAAAPSAFHKDFVNQVGPLPLTTIATLPADGEYLVSIVIVAAPVADPVGQAVGLSPIWTDEAGTVDSDFPPFSTSGSIPPTGSSPLRLQSTVSVHVKGGTPISVVGLVGGDSIHPYSAYVTVLSLN